MMRSARMILALAALSAGGAQAEKTKVFGLGLSKTGTTSMASAMEQLGYKTLHADQRLTPFVNEDFSPADLEGYYDDVDSVWDIPTAAYYTQLLGAYPNAKFVLTIRSDGSKSWYDSFSSYHNDYLFYLRGCEIPEHIQRLHEFVYGSRLPDEDIWTNSYKQHNDAVMAFFDKHAPDQLLVIDIFDSKKWEKLCTFLDTVDGPCAFDSTAPFPHENVAVYNNVKKECPKDKRYSEWFRLWDQVKERLEGEGYDTTKFVQPAEKTETHLRRVLQDVDPYDDSTPETPVDCDPEDDVALVLWDADADKEIGPLGDVIDVCEYPVGLTIRVLPDCKEKVKFKMTDVDTDEIVHKDTEGVAPLFMGGDLEGDDGVTVVDILPVPALSVPGSYLLQINPVPGGKIDFYFDVVGC